MLSGRYGCKEPLLEDQNEAETKHAILRSILSLKTEITQPRHERRHNLLNRLGSKSWIRVLKLTLLWTEKVWQEKLWSPKWSIFQTEFTKRNRGQKRSILSVKDFNLKFKFLQIRPRTCRTTTAIHGPSQTESFELYLFLHKINITVKDVSEISANEPMIWV